MVAMRVKGTGSFDPKTKTWRLRNKGIHITVRQLGIRYGVTWQSTTPAQLEKETASCWRRYLQDIEDTVHEQRKAVHPLRRRINSIEAAIARLKAQNRSTTDLDAMLTEAVAVDETTEHDYHDTPIVPPDLPPDLALGVKLGLVDVTDDFTTSWLNELVTKPEDETKNKSSIIKEAQDYVERYKIKSKSKYSWNNINKSLQLFLSITGDIPVEEVTAQHYRQLYLFIAKQDLTSNTKNSKMQFVKSFLNKLAIDNGLTTYGFLHNKDYSFERTEGNKEQYTIEQVKIALDIAEGEIRTALLLGLNCGFIAGDIQTLTPDMINGDYVIRSRDKLRHTKAIKGSWLMWDETKKSLKLGIKRVQVKYNTFAAHHGLPSHKALRKTTTQVIHDVVGDEEAARLFRCEKLHGTHGSNYVKNFTPQQIKRLDKALKRVAKVYGLS